MGSLASFVALPSRFQRTLLKAMDGSTDGDYLRFLSIASGSLAELETLFELAIDLGFSGPDKEFQEQCEQVGRMLTKLRQSLRIAEDSQSERYESAHESQNP